MPSDRLRCSELDKALYRPQCGRPTRQLALGGHTVVAHPCDRRRASARRRGPSLTPLRAPGLVLGRRARRAGRCRRCGPCARGAPPGVGPCTGVGQTSPVPHPTTAALRRGESVAAARGSPGGGPVAAGTGAVTEPLAERVGSGLGSYLAGAGRAMQWMDAPHRPERLGPTPGRQHRQSMLLLLS